MEHCLKPYEKLIESALEENESVRKPDMTQRARDVLEMVRIELHRFVRQSNYGGRRFLRLITSWFIQERRIKNPNCPKPTAGTLAVGGAVLIVVPILGSGGLETLLKKIIKIFNAKAIKVIIAKAERDDGKFDSTQSFVALGCTILSLSGIVEEHLVKHISGICRERTVTLIWVFGAARIYSVLHPIRVCNPGLRVADFLFNDWWHLPSFLFFQKDFDFVFVESRYLEGVLESKGVPRVMIRRAGFGVDLDFFRPRVGAENRHKLKIAYIGRFSWEKGPDLFVRLAGRFRSEKTLNFVMSGDGPYRYRIRSLNESFGSPVALLGHVSDVRSILQDCAALVVPSRIDGRPNVVMEALASGVPVLAARTGSIPELINEGENGLLCQPGSVSSFENGLRWVLARPGRLTEFSRQARDRAEKQFGADMDSCSANAILEVVGEIRCHPPLFSRATPNELKT